MATLEIKTAAELTDPALEARWAARRAARETDVLQRILRTFVDRGGPIPVEEIVLAFHDRPVDEIHDALIALNSDDLIRARDGHVDTRVPVLGRPDALCRPATRWNGALYLLRDRCARHCPNARAARPHSLAVSRLPHAPRFLRRPGCASAGGRWRHGVGRKDGRGPRQSSGLALNDAQLLPVGRASAGVERGESGSTRSRRHGGRGVQAGAPRLRRTSERRLITPNRAVTVYWSTT